MRALLPAAVLLMAVPIVSVSLAGPGLAQTPPPVVLVPEQNPPPASAPPAPPAPPPTVLLPPSSSEAPSDEAVARPRLPVAPQRSTAAILQALDKTTAETLRFEAPIGQPIRYKDLIFVVHVCENAAPGQRGASAHLEIQSSPRPIPGRETPPTRQLFRGWMFANAARPGRATPAAGARSGFQLRRSSRP